MEIRKGTIVARVRRFGMTRIEFTEDFGVVIRRGFWKKKWKVYFHSNYQPYLDERELIFLLQPKENYEKLTPQKAQETLEKYFSEIVEALKKKIGYFQRRAEEAEILEKEGIIIGIEKLLELAKAKPKTKKFYEPNEWLREEIRKLALEATEKGIIVSVVKKNESS